MIEETISIHDRYQFEIKLNYVLQAHSAVTAYNVEAYLFVPNSLGINRATYTKTAFYNDLQAYIRFKTPSIPLGELSGQADSPLEKLKDSLERLAQDASDEATARCEYQIKLFCCIAKSAVRDLVRAIANADEPSDRDRLVSDYLAGVATVSSDYRSLRSLIEQSSASETTFPCYFFGDEYLSLLIEDHTSHLLQVVASGGGGDGHPRKREIMDLIESEVSYRKDRGYPSIPDERSDNEQMLFRGSVLKKYMGSVLFLNTRAQRQGRMLEQAVFAAAAGVAMVFATAVAFVSQSIYGSLTLPVFFAIVVAYVFKDRIKELLRTYLTKGLSGLLFDHKLRIYSSPNDTIGVCKESFNFIEERNTPADVLKLRSRDHITEIENGWVGEKIILYRKSIKLFAKKIARIFRDYRIEGINDIIRFNVLEFLRKMDNPTKDLLVIDEDDYQRTTGDRVYHVNMILKYELSEALLCKRFRIVLNRKGIKRIEPVSVEKVIRK